VLNDDGRSTVFLTNVDMNNKKIDNLSDPTTDKGAATKKYVDKKIEESEDLNIKENNEENIFSFVLDDDLFKEDDSDFTKVGKVDKEFYNIHKDTYQFNIKYDSNIGYYSTRIGLDLRALPFGEYTLVF